MRHALAAALLLLCAAAGAQGRLPATTAAEPRSPAIYPPQEIALRFSHAQHLRRQVRCEQCHGEVSRSEQAADRNIPGESRCAICHEIEEAAAGKATDPPSACRDCHPGFDPGAEKAPRPSSFPPPNLHFSHRRHLARGAQCAECHGEMIQVDLATRAQLPRMATCLACHDGRKAPADCATCHLLAGRARGARIETQLPSGVLKPGPGNPLGLDHGPLFERTHARLAAGQRAQCAACHSENWCARCHDGATRPQSIHPNDFITVHPMAARQMDQRCDACHRRQSFCVACHERTGVGASADPSFRDPGARVHPPGWLVPGPGHHGVQAARGISSCASCHREEHCLGCHATSSPGAPSLGVRPHPPGFARHCREMMRKSERACLKCHDLSVPTDSAAGLCR